MVKLGSGPLGRSGDLNNRTSHCSDHLMKLSSSWNYELMMREVDEIAVVKIMREFLMCGLIQLLVIITSQSLYGADARLFN